MPREVQQMQAQPQKRLRHPLLQVLVLAVPMPWRAFPLARHVSSGALVAVYLACQAWFLLLIVVRMWQDAAVAPFALRGHTLGMVRGNAYDVAAFWLILSVCGAGRHERLRESLARGLRYGLLAATSWLLWWQFVYTGISLATVGSIACPPEVFLYAAWPRLQVLLAYGEFATMLTAGWLADRQDMLHGATALLEADSIWPRCVQCEYSLRGLAGVEVWRERLLRGQPGQAEPAPPEGICPECGKSVSTSLRQRAEQLRQMAIDYGQSVSRGVGTLARHLVFFGWNRLIPWILQSRRLTVAACWSIGFIVTAAAMVVYVWLDVRTWVPPRSGSALMWYHLYSREVLVITGATILALGLLLSLRARRNQLWVAHGASAPLLWAAAILVVAYPARVGGLPMPTRSYAPAFEVPWLILCLPIAGLLAWLAHRRLGFARPRAAHSQD